MISWATVSALCACLTAIVVHLLVSEAPIEWEPYLFSFGVIFWPALVMATLVSSALYLLTRSLDLAFLGFAALYWAAVASPSYLTRWIQTPISSI